MELKQIKDLMTAMGRSGIKRLVLKKEGVELEIERTETGMYKIPDVLESSAEPGYALDHARRADLALSRANESSSSLSGASTAPVDIIKEGGGVFVTSPMVGTFYSAPSPEDAAFIKVGDKIEKNTVVCIIEAMKVMNEIKANVAGTVVEALIESGHPVEFGTKLFRIAP